VKGGGGRWVYAIGPTYDPTTGDATFTMGHDSTLTRGMRCVFTPDRRGYSKATSDAVDIIPE
jgi:hypothetical protein